MLPRWSDSEESASRHRFSGVLAAVFGSGLPLEGAVQIEMYRDVVRGHLSTQRISGPNLVVHRNFNLACGMIAGDRSEYDKSVQ